MVKKKVASGIEVPVSPETPLNWSVLVFVAGGTKTRPEHAVGIVMVLAPDAMTGPKTIGTIVPVTTSGPMATLPKGSPVDGDWTVTATPAMGYASGDTVVSVKSLAAVETAAVSPFTSGML